MKWAIVILIILGLLAAVSATLLVNAIRTEQRTTLKGGGEVQAVVALRSMPAMSWITSQNITVKKVPRKGVAVDYFAEPVQVIGKVLAVPVVKGQVLTKSSLITEGSGAQLAAALPHGMRAVSVPVPRHSVMGGLLYPGCLVDVIATFRLRSRDMERQAMSTTLLHGIQVLAVQNESIISKADQEKDKKSGFGGRGPSGRDLTVTLMVDTKQAEALQLAMNNGRITLAMKNPLDHKAIPVDGTVLSQGRLAKLGDLLTPTVFAAPGETGYIDTNNLEALLDDPNGLNISSTSATGTLSSTSATGDETERLRQFFYPESATRTPLKWQITVIRGQKTTEEVFDILEDEAKAEK